MDSREQFSATVALGFIIFKISDGRKQQCLLEPPKGRPERRRRFLYNSQALEISGNAPMNFILRELFVTLHKVTIELNGD